MSDFSTDFLNETTAGSSQKAMQAREKAWAFLESNKDAIDRISEEGPTSPEDVQLVQRVLLVVAGELRMRKTGDVR